MDAFLDADILISIYNGRPQAVSWLQINSKLTLGITPVAWMEVLRGGQNKVAQQRLTQYLAHYPVIDLTNTDQNWAMRQYQTYKLSHGVGILDCLIAAPCYRLQIPLYTRNLKHMTPLLGALAVQPYL